MKKAEAEISQEIAYQFLMSPGLKFWFLERFDSPAFTQPYDKFMKSFSKFLRIKGTGKKYYFKVGDMMFSFMVSHAGDLILTMGEGQQISGFATCPLTFPL
ncbi:hypothetical protein [Anabaena sp. UHCC 0204]|uniref:hypothetical protein n=1 Tax=Anabaena sp. UHCC 0204 TaxID=2590009 RepID=UPI0014452D86|nr:hypothetical protein [Anabaena sp. UHCC 0204]MTJ10537.1 hypothetical protein [Anabaena sp. UHCC 0204]